VVTQELKKDSRFIEKHKADLAASLQNTITEILVQKIELALKETGINQLAIGGGVAANSGIRKALNALAQRQSLQLFVPELSYCTDNAAMIGISGYFKYIATDFADLSVQAEARYAVQS
jgi:N6-L-threonylcarbamoyladenine synthase